MALEAVQAQAGHASIESTRIYLHLANDWLAREYLRRGGGDRRAARPARAEGECGVSRLARDPEVEALVAAYRADLRRPACSRRTRSPHRRASFLLRVGARRAGRDCRSSSSCAVRARGARGWSWMIVAGHVRPTPEFLAAASASGRSRPGSTASSTGGSCELAAELGFAPKVAELQWWAVAKVAARRRRTRRQRLNRGSFDAASADAASADARPEHPRPRTGV